VSAIIDTEFTDFPGGLHLSDHKTQSIGRPIGMLPMPARLVLPLQQHIGNAAEPVVEVGERVLKGQMIARASDYVSAPLHAPTSGSIQALDEQLVPHPSGLSALCIAIEPDGLDEWSELPAPLPDYIHWDPADLRERIRWAGVVGLGGAAFPTSIKINPGTDRPVDTLIINGAECEPYITCDDVLMRERAAQVIAGIGVLKYIVAAKTCLIGIEDNKKDAAEAMRAALEYAELDAQIVMIPTKYPSGGEKQLIYLLTGKEVPSHGIPAEIGIICQNVGTAAAVGDVVLHGRPLISRIVTVTGSGVKTPQNVETLLGTPVASLIEFADGYTPDAKRLILGGPMMGFAMRTDAVPVTKAANCLLVESAADTPVLHEPGPCIRCGECARVCPMQLLPQQLYWFAKAKDLDKVQDYDLFDCIECGCCAYVCPSHIPLVQYYRYAKTETWTQEREKRKSDLARRRHDARIARLDRLEAERKTRLRKKKEALEKKPGAAKQVDPKKAAIEAAMQRVAAKKAAANQAAASAEARVPKES